MAQTSRRRGRIRARPYHSHRGARAGAGALASVMLAGAVIVANAPMASGGVAIINAWMSNPLHVVGGPVVGDGMILINAVTSAHKLQLSAVSWGAQVAWSVPSSQSGITAGESFSPAFIGSVAINLAPDGSEANPDVFVEGLDIATGRVLWKMFSAVVVVDAPHACGADKYFCLTLSTGTGAILVELNPLTGKLEHFVVGPQRNLGVSAPGASNTFQLWQSDATTATLEGTSSVARIVWRDTVAHLFAGPQFSPDNGWDFVVSNDLSVGSVGVAAHGGAYDLSSERTVAIANATGSVEWISPGMYQCMGTLAFLDDDVTCVFTGEVTSTGSLAHVTLTLKGLDRATGDVTWSEPISDVANLTFARNLAFVDGYHLVVEDAHKNWVVLDTRNGSTTAVTKGELFWCEDLSSYSVVALTGIAHSDARAGVPRFYGCNAPGQKLKGTPTFSRTLAENYVGVTLKGFFVWASPLALNGVRVVPKFSQGL